MTSTRIHFPNITDKKQSNSKAYYITFRDRSDSNPLAVFFMVYSKADDSVLWTSATYYNECEMDRVALHILNEVTK
jgi:hypothetical protein